MKLERDQLGLFRCDVIMRAELRGVMGCVIILSTHTKLTIGIKFTVRAGFTLKWPKSHLLLCSKIVNVCLPILKQAHNNIHRLLLIMSGTVHFFVISVSLQLLLSYCRPFTGSFHRRFTQVVEGNKYCGCNSEMDLFPPIKHLTINSVHVLCFFEAFTFVAI